MAADPEHWPELVEKHRVLWLTEPNFTKEQLDSIKVPVLVLDGQYDESVAAGHPETIANAVPNAKLVIMRGATHFAPHMKAAQFNQILLDYLKDR